jgi:tetratricopeptide (TPR) repeat protein
MVYKSPLKFLTFLTLTQISFLLSCAHHGGFHESEQNGETLIYNLMGTKAAFLNKQTFHHEQIAEYEKQVQIDKILELPVDHYKLWLEQTAAHFAKRAKPDSLYRYIGRDLFFKASILEKYGHLEKAEGLFSLLFQHFDISEESLVHHAVLVLKLGDLEKARLSLLKAIDLASDQERKNDLIQVWLNVSEAMGKNEVLRDDFSKAMKISKNHFSVCSRLGKYLQEKNQTSEALEVLNTCLEKQNSAVAKQMVSLELAKIYIQKLNFTKAESLLSKFEKQKNIEADVALLIGLLHEQQGREQRQISVYEHYMSSGGVDNRILERLSDYYFQKNSFEKGVTPLKVLTDSYPSNINYKYRLAVANLQMGQYQQAINLLMELKKMGGNSHQISLYLFKAYNGLNQPEKALAHLRLFEADEVIQLEALTLAGDYFTDKLRSASTDEVTQVTSLWNEFLMGYKKVENTIEWKLQYAMSLEALNKVQDAIDVLEKAQSSMEFQEFQLYYLASLHERMKNYDKTDQLLSSILQKNPNFAHAWNFLGYSHLEREQGNLELAKTCIKKAVSLDPKSPHFRDSLGWYYYKVGEWNKALKELQIAYTLDNKDVTIAKHLVQVLVAMKQIEQASEMMKRISQNFPSEDFSDLKNQIKVDRAPASE